MARAKRPPMVCDVCHGPIAGSFVDGRTTMGPWANMCMTCHATHGVGLGMGKGQRYTFTKGERHDNADAAWLKTAG